MLSTPSAGRRLRAKGVAEGVQVLEPQMHAAMNELDYIPTRFGRKVLAAGKVEGAVATSVPRMD